jgi:hypothetical protein
VLDCLDDADAETRGAEERGEHKTFVRCEVLPRRSVCSRSVLLREVFHREGDTACGYTALV